MGEKSRLKIFEILFWHETSKNDHTRGAVRLQVPLLPSECLLLLSKNVFLFPELSPYFPELPFHFPEVPSCFLELPFYFLEVSFCFPEVSVHFLKEALLFSRISY